MSDLTFYYPSTVFIDEETPEFSEYVTAKSLGETMIGQLEKVYPETRFVVSRLPRLATDQTQFLVPLKKADPLPLMLQELRKIHRPS